MSKKEEFLEDDETRDYKKRLAAFMAEVNPKPSLEQVEVLKQQYLARQGVNN